MSDQYGQDDEPLPEFPEDVAAQYGGSDWDLSGQATDTGVVNICLEFCIWVNGRPWKDMWFCAPSPEEIQDQVGLFLSVLQQMGFSAQATQGACPVS